jgi:hypothetical protein
MATNGTNGVSAEALTRAYELGAQGRTPITGPDGGVHVALPEGWELEKIPPLEEPLTHVKQHATLLDLDSFNDYVNLFKDEKTTRIFGAPGHLNSGIPFIKAVLDYHADAKTSGRNAHVATYQPPYSAEWTRWHSINNRPMKQVDFAEWIEENRRDIRKPDAGTLFDLVRRFKATKKQDYDSVVYQSSGSQEITWKDNTTGANGTIPVPDKLTLGIKVFFQSTVYAIDCFMRYRLSEGALTFTVKLDRADLIEDAAFTELTSTVKEKTGVSVFLGRP